MPVYIIEYKYYTYQGCARIIPGRYGITNGYSFGYYYLFVISGKQGLYYNSVDNGGALKQ